MMSPQRALVRPRVLSPESGDSVLLEDEIQQFLEAEGEGVVALLGQEGSGKTTALRHLAAVLGSSSNLILLDEPDGAAIARAVACGLVVYAATTARPGAHRATFRLAPWGPDDWLEYLLAAHRPRCGSVLARVGQGDTLLLGGLPERWVAILDRLAADEALPDARRALHRQLGEFLCDTDLLERARSACLNAVLAGNDDWNAQVMPLARPGFGPALVRALRCPAARLLLAAERIAADLHTDASCDHLAHRLPRDLVKTTALLAKGDAPAREHLLRLLEGPGWSHAMSASLLHALGAGWLPNEGATPCLAGAYLDGVHWPGVWLSGADLTRADLEGANLERAILIETRAAEAVFRGAILSRAILDRMAAPGADFRGAKLSRAVAHGAQLSSASLAGADLAGAVLADAGLCGADLRNAVLHGADLRSAWLTDARIDGADFGGADLTGANLSNLDLREARWDGAVFHEAQLENCDLEYLTLPAADFGRARLAGALLTGTTMPAAAFHHADLRNTGLAEVDWVGADLRGADLRGASFHLGSTRSGLVGSPIACEGSRTGFYTDEYEEQTYKDPQEIRKANLCGADLRGALLEDVDFYLVDLRGAQYNPDQAMHLRRCGAILEARV
jgi:uncharacterized protein YjbI with pentapeptide repeats/energy-coupling factor transporter ATP-binding protein EcfA2